ncbi:MAG: ABC transporter ATP-binding protein [Gammaproteobacteria bacterium]|jgi:ABC-2 type transport system ATP-binding protein|nr:ABC transporter ATP-binding protein [Gammaproteobacteria bacterium]
MIEVSHLTKYYSDFAAVKDLSFKLVPGEILGFLGPNGAGKSTAMKMLTGFLRPTSGEVRIWGSDMWQDSLTAQRHIGYLPEGAPAYEEMTALGFLQFIADARGLTGAERANRLDETIEVMSLQGVLGQRFETLSKGFKRRVGLAQAILHDPDVLILDEPTDGLDPNQKHQVREMIKGLSRDKIVIVSTHILEEVTAVCNRAMVLAKGRVVSDGTPQSLLAMSPYHGAVTLESASAPLSEIAEAAGSIKGVKETILTEVGVTIFPGEVDATLFTKVLELSRSKGWTVDSLHVESGRLDDVFRSLTEGESR